MPDTTPTPEWMHFVNFDGRLTGATAQIVKQVTGPRQGADPCRELARWAKS